MTYLLSDSTVRVGGLGGGGCDLGRAGAFGTADQGTSSLAFTYTVRGYPPVFLLPGGFTEECFVRAGSLTPKEARTMWPKAACLVHSVLERGACSPSARADGGAVPVCAHYWQRQLGSHSRRIMQILQRAGVLELVAEKDQAAGKSRLFRIGSNFRTMPLYWVPVRSAAIVRKKRERHRQAIAGLDEIRRFVWRNVRQITVPPALLKRIQRTKFASQLQQARIMLSVQALMSGDVWISSPGGSNDRLYHSVVNFSKTFRRDLLLAGEPVGEADIGSAMPFFCLGLYEDSANGERKRYAEAVCGGRFYEIIRDKLPIAEADEYRASWAISRGTFKATFNADVLFSGLRGSPPELFRAFRALFPVLASVLARKRFTKSGANALAALLRKWEADLMFGQVIPRIRREIKGCLPVSLHDGILCQARFLSQVAEVLADEAAARFGSIPSVKMKG